MCEKYEDTENMDSLKEKKQIIHPGILELGEYSSPACLLSEFSDDFDEASYGLRVTGYA